ncbi:MAG: four helix bundle protein [Planctomycetaceae bacterium]
MTSYRDLKVWKRGMDLVEYVYQLTRSLPPEELYGLTSQTRRSAVSIPSNIAEGHGRKSTGAFINHLSIAQGSTAELETQLLLLCQRLGFISQDDCDSQIETTDEIGRMLTGLKRSLTKS